jgi:hypothetical protein
LRICHLRDPANAPFRGWRTSGGLTSVTDLEISFVHLFTFSDLLHILAAIPSLQRVSLSEISWSSIGVVPHPHDFRHLRSLSVHCTGTKDILHWLSKGTLPALNIFTVSIRHLSSSNFLHAVGMSLHQLKLDMSADLQYELHEGVSFKKKVNCI